MAKIYNFEEFLNQKYEDIDINILLERFNTQLSTALSLYYFYYKRDLNPQESFVHSLISKELEIKIGPLEGYIVSQFIKLFDNDIIALLETYCPVENNKISVIEPGLMHNIINDFFGSKVNEFKRKLLDILTYCVQNPLRFKES